MHYDIYNERQKDFVLNIKTYFNQENNTVIYDKRNVIKVVEFEGKKYVVKSFKIPHLLNQIVYRFWRDSKAKRSFNNSIQLERLGIPTPKPIGFIEFPTPLKFKESFYIAEFFDFDFEIRAVFKDKNFEDRENILKRFIEFTHILHQRKVYHIDYSPGNILVKRVEGIYTFSIIDVNRMQFLELDEALRMKSFSKLSNDEKDNKFMVKYYAQIAQLSFERLYPKLLQALKEQEKYLSNKKRLKKIKGK